MIIDFLSFAASAAGASPGVWASIVHDFSNITEPAAFSTFLQVLMIDRLPPSSILRAAPKKRLGRWSALASTPPVRTLPELGTTVL